jgi:hypothetical protein
MFVKQVRWKKNLRKVLKEGNGMAVLGNAAVVCFLNKREAVQTI